MRRYIVGLFITSLLVVAGLLVHTLQQAQPVTAQTCSVAPVNLQFRAADPATDNGIWLNGSQMQVSVGSRVDINCFANSGQSLLSGGRITGQRQINGQTVALTGLGTTNQIRDYLISQAGTYVFSCTNGAACSDSDTFTVVAPVTSPSPSPTPAAPVSPSPITSVSCGNLQAVEQTTLQPLAQSPVSGNTVRFRCSAAGGVQPDYYFFTYRDSETAELRLIYQGTSDLTFPIAIGNYAQVQCNPCVGNVCATAATVNSNCTFQYKASTAATPSPTPGVTPTPTPSPTPGSTFSPADLNRDGKVNVDDYALFVEYYRADVSK